MVMSEAVAGGKRKRVEIDLTISDDEKENNGPVKTSKKTTSNLNRQRSLPTPPASSARSNGYESVYGAPSSSFPQSSQHFTQQDRDAWLNDDDFNAVIESSEDDAEFNENLHLYGALSTKVVGVRFYRGYANPGEQILIRREPGNQYDSNAIRICNVQGTQIGHIPRGPASKLAKYIDNGWLHVEGKLDGEIGQFDCPLLVSMYGPHPESVEGRQLSNKMVADKLPLTAFREATRNLQKSRKEEEQERLAAARRAAAAAKEAKYTNQATSSGSSQQVTMPDIMEASQRINPRDVASSADQLGLSEENLSNMPMVEQPDGIKTKMLPYQRQALRWLLDQESPNPPTHGAEQSVQLWRQERNGRYNNLATNFSTQDLPTLASGGILADDMGLGKTLEMISLIVADNEKFGRGTTLIIAPLSVMSNWTGQIATHVKESLNMKAYTYHAEGRTKMKAEDFEQYDVVLTTYQTLAREYMPGGKNSKQPERKLRPNGLFSVKYRRVILDEGHQVRNPKTAMALAVCALFARSRWALTGTPIVNSLADLYSLLKFIGITGGLDRLDVFNQVLVRPIKNGSESATVLLKLIMKSFTLRRRKDMAFIDLKLPKLEEFVHKIDFTEKERQRYNALYVQAKGMLQKYKDKSVAGGRAASGAYMHILEILLRLRQCCNHWMLCGERLTNLLAQLETQKTVALTPENRKALREVLQVQIESQEDCAICLDTLHNPVITTCSHAFGRECISKVIETQHKCPMCRAELADEKVLVEPAYGGDDAADDDLDLTQSSSKLEALMRILEATKGNGNKTIIFSQWTRFLDIVQSRLKREGYGFCRLDGTMSASKRDDALIALEQDDKTTVMLASLGVCAVGLNLTPANNVILLDTWWAPAIEDQAVDRVHRLGQKKETRVFRLVMDGSVEEDTLAVQSDKRKLMMVAFSEKNKRDGAKSGRLADIQRLLSRPIEATGGASGDVAASKTSW